MTGAALLSLALGLLLRPLALRRWPPVPLCCPWVPLALVGVEVLGVLAGLPLQGAVYLGVFLWVGLNRHPVLLPLLLGAGFNGLVILVHGGMPVDPRALERAGLGSTASFLEAKGDGLHFLGPAFPLGDWIALPGRVLSPGDLLICLSLFLVAMRGVRYDKEGS